MIEVDHQINAVRRTVGRRTLEAGEAHVVTVSQAYDTTVEDLWDCCTNAERLPRWFLPVTGELRVGGRYQLEGNAGGEILECEPPHRLAATWEYGDAVSWIEVAVTPEGDGARVTLEHLALPDEHWDQFGPGAVGIGWDLAVVGLALHLETGVPVDAAEVQAWTISPDGLRFMTDSGTAWGEADADFGEDPEVAPARPPSAPSPRTRLSPRPDRAAFRSTACTEHARTEGGKGHRRCCSFSVGSRPERRSERSPHGRSRGESARSAVGGQESHTVEPSHRTGTT